MHPLRLQPFLAVLRERDPRPQPLARPLLVVHADRARPRPENLPPPPPLLPYALFHRLERLHAFRELRLQVHPVVLFESDRGVHFEVAGVGGSGRGVRGAVFELVAVEVADGGVGGGGGRAVGAVCAAVFAGGDGFAGDGLVDYVRGVGALGRGVEAGLGEGDRLGGFVVCWRHLWDTRISFGGGRRFGPDGQLLSC